MASAKFLKHGHEICFSFSGVCTAHDDGNEINHVTAKFPVVYSAIYCRRAGVNSGNAGEGMLLISGSIWRHS
jgi:hypothetical protein